MTIIRPQDFGATDRTGKSDESIPLQNAISAVSNTRNILDLDGGNWRYDRQLLLLGSVNIQNGQLSYGGPGRVISLLAKPIPDKLTDEIPSPVPQSTNKSTLILDNVCIHRIQNKNQVGLQIEEGFRAHLRRVDFTNWRNGGIALRLKGVQYGHFEDCLIEEAETSLVITGLNNEPPSTTLTFVHCQFRSHFGKGQSVVLSPYKKITAGSTESTSGARKCAFEFCYFENGRNGGFIEANSTRFLTLLNCYFEDPGDDSPEVEFHNETTESMMANKILYCTFSNTKGTNAPAHIRIGKGVKNTLLIGNSHAVSTEAVEDNGIDTIIMHQI